MISHIKLKNFRVYDSLDLDINNSFIIFSGKNAVGKTSILESMFIASTTKSHRTNNLPDVIKFNNEFSVIEINKYKVVISKEGKSLFINNHEIKKSKDYLGNLNVVMICPEDISLINGSKQDKRRFLDMNLSIIDKKYLNESSKYKKLINERNVMLKDKNINKMMMDILNKEISSSLKYIYDTRINFLEKINNYLIDICKNLKISEIKLDYRVTYNPNDIEKSFNNKLETDIYNKVTSIGSHRDYFIINYNELDSSRFSSEGESRIIYIAIKLALKMIFDEYKMDIILLLDDIYQALDKNKIESLTRYVKSSKQVFITTTSIFDVPEELIKDASVIRIDNIKESKNGRS